VADSEHSNYIAFCPLSETCLNHVVIGCHYTDKYYLFLMYEISHNSHN